MKKVGIMIERQRAYGRRLCEGVMRFSQTRDDWVLEMLEWEDPEHPQRLRDFDGFIVRALTAKTAEAFARTGKPVVDVYANAPFSGIATVDQFARYIGQLAVRHFVEHRFTRFAFFGHEGIRYSDLRRDAFVECLRLNRMSCDVYPTPTSTIQDFDFSVMKLERYSAGREERSIRKWLKGLEKPVAIFCSHDLRAYQLIRVCKAAGIRVPEDVAVLGVDNDEFICNFVAPSISSIDPAAEEIGHTAARTLAGIMDGTGTPVQIRVKPKGLIERGSTKIYPIDPPWLSDALVFIRGNVTRRISPSDVFAHLGKSHTLVDAAFRRTLGTTVSKVIAESRTTEAMRLVTGSSIPLSEIATRCGFASVQYFNKSFSSAFGKPPSSFRAG